jgi:hypothetical protein
MTDPIGWQPAPAEKEYFGEKDPIEAACCKPPKMPAVRQG